MARSKFQVEVLTPEGEVFNDEVEMLSTRTSVGSIGVLANHTPLLGMLERLQLTLVIGQHAASYHLPAERSGLTAAVQNWRAYWPGTVPLPHPSPINNGWLARNRWFEQTLVPLLRTRVGEVLRGAG